MSGRCATCGREDQLRRGLCHNHYEQDRRAGTIVTSLVDATPAKAKIADLLAAGWGQRRIAKAAGINRSLVSWIMRGRATIAAKTRDAICALDAETDPAAIAHRELVEAGMRGEYVSPQRKYRQARAARRRDGVEDARRLRWVAKELGVVPEQLAAERRRERRLPFPDAYAEMRHHCGLSDWEIARRMGIANESLLRQCARYGISPRPEFVSACSSDPQRQKR